MKIRNLTRTSAFRRVGLDFETMRDLKQLVVLFGRNGAGKSRLLRSIAIHINERYTEVERARRYLSDNTHLNTKQKQSEEYL